MNPGHRDSDSSLGIHASQASASGAAWEVARFACRGLLRWGQAACAALLLAAGSQAQGAVIDYSVTALGPQSWQYDYTVTNDSEILTIDEFTIYFDRTLFGNLAIALSPVNWDPLVIQPDPELPSNGFFDALALAFGIAPGTALSGFSVTFDFLGSGIPGSQPFDVVDPLTFEVLQSGFTSLAAQTVPEPGTLALLLVGGIAAAAVQRRRREAFIELKST